MQLFDDIRSSILNKNIDIEKAVKTVTSNVAKVLKIFPRKGALSKGSDADILVLNEGDLSIDKLMINGEFFIDNGNVLRKGRYEK
jgi:beta-aspartyl-dipeptidase (metallo-type)